MSRTSTAKSTLPTGIQTQVTGTKARMLNTRQTWLLNADQHTSTHLTSYIYQEPKITTHCIPRVISPGTISFLACDKTLLCCNVMWNGSGRGRWNFQLKYKVPQGLSWNYPYCMILHPTSQYMRPSLFTYSSIFKNKNLPLAFNVFYAQIFYSIPMYAAIY